MIDLDWLNDERTADPADYLIPWNALKSRQRAFLAGWTWLPGGGSSPGRPCGLVRCGCFTPASWGAYRRNSAGGSTMERSLNL